MKSNQILTSPYVPLQTKTKLQSYIWKFQYLPTKEIYTSNAVSEAKARNNICYKVFNTQKINRDVFNSQLKLIFCSNPIHNPQYIQKIRQTEVEKDIWDTCIENNWALNTHLKKNKSNKSNKEIINEVEISVKNFQKQYTQKDIWDFL